MRFPARVLVAAGVFAICATLYLCTMSRSVSFIDRGELAAAACTMGIAHPTGYPTLILLAHAVQAVVPGRPIVVLNGLAAVLVALGAALLVLLAYRFLESLGGSTWARPNSKAAARKKAPAGSRSTLSESMRAIYAGCASLLIATSVTVWQQANGFEVYSFQLFLLPVLGLALLRDLERPTIVSGMLFGLILGLTFTNHLTVVVLAPAFLAAWFVRFGLRPGLARILWPVAPALLVGLLPYVWLLLRASAEPRLSWGDPHDFGRLMAHVTGKQYQLWMFSSAEDARLQAAYAFSRLPWDLAFAGAAVAIVGGTFLARRDRGAMVFACLIVATSLVYLVGYGIRDVDPYALPALMGLGLLVAAGWAALHQRFGARVTLAVAGALIVVNGALHFRSCNERDLTLSEGLVRDLLEPLPERSVVFSSLWDHVISPSLYMQIVEGLRPDVTVISTELLRHPWYVRELARRDPELMALVRTEAEGHERATRSGTGVGAAYDGLVAGIIRHAAPTRGIFATCEVDLAPLRGFVATPCGLAVEFRADSGYVACADPALRLRPWRGRADLYVATHHLLYGQSLVLRSQYEARHGFHDRALAAAQSAVGFAPPFASKDIPVLPLDGARLALESVRFFTRLRGSVNAGLPELR